MTKASRWTEEYIVGVDEAGRGPLAGPVTVGVSLIPRSTSKKLFAFLQKEGMNDSKQVKEKDRERIFKILTQLKKEGKLDFVVFSTSAKIISDKGIVFAINSVIIKGLKKVLARHPSLVRHCSSVRHSHEGGNPEIKRLDSRIRGNDGLRENETLIENTITLQMDGALKIPKGNWKKSGVYTKGDSLYPSIMLASIVAKVTRDRYMKKISKKFPEYQLDVHKGYGTKLHRELIKRHGVSEIHRKGWCK